jgi:hypothetical protein
VECKAFSYEGVSMRQSTMPAYGVVNSTISVYNVNSMLKSVMGDFLYDDGNMRGMDDDAIKDFLREIDGVLEASGPDIPKSPQVGSSAHQSDPGEFSGMVDDAADYLERERYVRRYIRLMQCIIVLRSVMMQCAPSYIVSRACGSMPDDASSKDDNWLTAGLPDSIYDDIKKSSYAGVQESQKIASLAFSIGKALEHMVGDYNERAVPAAVPCAAVGVPTNIMQMAVDIGIHDKVVAAADCSRILALSKNDKLFKQSDELKELVANCVDCALFFDSFCKQVTPHLLPLFSRFIREGIESFSFIEVHNEFRNVLNSAWHNKLRPLLYKPLSLPYYALSCESLSLLCREPDGYNVTEITDDQSMDSTLPSTGQTYHLASLTTSEDHAQNSAPKAVKPKIGRKRQHESEQQEAGDSHSKKAKVGELVLTSKDGGFALRSLPHRENGLVITDITDDEAPTSALSNCSSVVAVRAEAASPTP